MKLFQLVILISFLNCFVKSCAVCKSKFLKGKEVCGADGKTYATRCHANMCAQVKVAYRGPCTCQCDQFGYEPVCASDGNTYRNFCSAMCNDRFILYDGLCMNQCNCNNSYNPVCGVNGKSYDSDCYANCFDIDVSHPGPCYT